MVDLQNIILASHVAGDLCALVQMIRHFPKVEQKVRNYKQELVEFQEKPEEQISPVDIEQLRKLMPDIFKDFFKPVLLYGYIPFQVIALGSMAVEYFSR